MAKHLRESEIYLCKWWWMVASLILMMVWGWAAKKTGVETDEHYPKSILKWISNKEFFFLKNITLHRGKWVTSWPNMAKPSGMWTVSHTGPRWDGMISNHESSESSNFIFFHRNSGHYECAHQKQTELASSYFQSHLLLGVQISKKTLSQADTCRALVLALFAIEQLRLSLIGDSRSNVMLQ